MINQPLFANFFQIAYVTNDFEKAVRVFRTDYGIPDFLIRDGEYTVNTPQGPEHIVMRAGLAFVGDTNIELIQSTAGDSKFYDQVLPSDRFAIAHHHIGFHIKELDAWTKFRENIGNSGNRIAVEGSSEAVKWIYVDKRQELGHLLEYVWMGPALLELMKAAPRF